MPQDRLTKRIKFVPELINKIAKIDEFKGLWQGGLRLNPQILGRLKKSVIITSTGASTRIEGAKMEDDEIARLLHGLKSRPPKNRDEQEVAGYAELISRIFDNYKTLKLTEGQILQFHSMLLKFSKKDQKHRGKYKTKNNIVVARIESGEQKILFKPTPPYLVKKEMDDALFWANEQFTKNQLHPLLIIFSLIFEFLAIHPFEDGNGRLSRALTNLLLLKAGYTYVPYVSLEEIIEDRLSDYYLSLRATQKHHKTAKEEITAWLDFSLDALIEQTRKAKNIMDKTQPEKLLSEKQQQVFDLFQKRMNLSVSEIDKQLKGKIPKVTIKQALNKLLNLNLIERIGEGRGTRYKILQQ